jgi:hypothetical protein
VCGRSLSAPNLIDQDGHRSVTLVTHPKGSASASRSRSEVEPFRVRNLQKRKTLRNNEVALRPFEQLGAKRFQT